MQTVTWLNLYADHSPTVDRYHSTVFVTPELAQACLDRNTHNRPLNAKQVLQHIERIREGYFLPSPDAVAFDTNGVLLEGQHRLTAIVNGGKGAYLNFDFGYPPETFHVLGEGRPRSVADHQGLLNVDFPKDRASAAKILMTMDQLAHGDHQAVVRYIAGLDQGKFADAVQFGNDMRNRKLVSSVAHAAAAYYFTLSRSGVTQNWESFVQELLLGSDAQPALIRSLLRWLLDKTVTDTREGIPKGVERVKMFAMTWVRFNGKGSFLPAAYRLGLGEVQTALETLVYSVKI
jgi:hypothetical protein